MTIKLDKQQQDVVNHFDGKIAVVAAPGSGKTRTLVERANNLVKNKKADFSEILLITFTEKAKHEIKERFNLNGFKPEIETFHSLAYKTISIYYSKHENKKINIMNSTEDILVDKIARVDSKNDSEYNKRKLDIKNKYSLFSFDDLLFSFKELLQSKYSLLNNITKFKYIMVDECQDLDEIQYEIINLICCNNLMLIGDLNQSIYGWRGAKLQLFKDYYHNCDKSYNLSNNYRSGKDIIDLSNLLISKNKDRVEVETNNINKVPSFVIKKVFKKAEEQAEWICDNIKNKTKDNVKIAIILRCDYQKEIIVDSLLENDIKYNVLITKHEELNDVISIYKGLNGNILAMFQIAERLNLEVSQNHIDSVSDENLNYIKDVLQKVNKKSINIIDKIREVLNKLNYFPIAYHNSNESLEIVNKILDVSIEKLNHKKNRYEDFGYILSTLTMNSLILNNPENNKDYTVDIMTIHSSKGLEYDYVFIPDVNENLLPHKRGVLEEERRLFYVGITRAKQGVYISSVKSSIFLDEI